MNRSDSCKAMREPRLFYCPDAASTVSSGGATTRTVFLPSDESHHAAQVLRLKASEAVRLFDGAGIFYEGRIARTAKRIVEVEILSSFSSAAEPRCRVVLIVGSLKGRKVDFLVQKAVELGVAEIAFFPAERSVAKSKAVDTHGVADERLDRIVVSACKQCGRAGLMSVRFFASLDAALACVPDGMSRYVFWEEMKREENSVPRMLDVPPGGACALIGPEGGFASDEIKRVRATGFEVRSLGRRILRAETAALAAAVLLLDRASELS